jgi:uncharacterized protein YbjT (DUF2867 family)
MWDSDDQKKQSVQYAKNFSTAIRAAGVKNVVFLSSYGAHRLDDAGAISGCGLAEVVLNELDAVNVLSLRVGYFYSNLLLPLDLVKTSGHMGNMFTIPDGTFTVVDTDDIARAAAEALDTLNFEGHSHIYVISDLTGTDEIASLIGKEIGSPDLRWLKFPAAKCSPPSIPAFCLRIFRRRSRRSQGHRSRNSQKPGLRPTDEVFEPEHRPL